MLLKGYPIRRRSCVGRYCAVVSIVLNIYAIWNIVTIIFSSVYEVPEDNKTFSFRQQQARSLLLQEESGRIHNKNTSTSSASKTKIENVRSANLVETEKESNFLARLKNLLGLGKDSSSNDGTKANPINADSFDYVIKAPNICADDEVFLLVYVHSAPANFKQRIVIRQTWGDVTQYDVTVRVIFVMGIHNDDPLNHEVQFEADTYGDIVQENFTDSYRNLTLKAVAALKWVAGFCSRSNFVLKTDDDIFVNIFLLLRYLQLQLKKCGGLRCQGLLMCLVWNNMAVMRTGKWKVEETEWKEEVYPQYCSGSAFIMSVDSAIAFYHASFDVPFFWVDDVYVTGLLPAKVGGITYVDFAAHYLLDGTMLKEKFTGAQWINYVFSHVPDDLNSMLYVWRKVVAIWKGELWPTIPFVSL